MKKTFFIFSVFILNAFFAYGDDLISSNIPNGCSFSDTNQGMVARFEPNEYTCNAGYYLPADSTSCASCLSGYTCAGGTYAFYEYADQGIEMNIPITTNVGNSCGRTGSQLFGRFAPNEYTCNAGYYLPADGIECVQCPANNYCVGGTYTFNKTTTQGISGQCATGYSAPAGSSSCTPNTITVRWDDGNGGAYSTTCTYGGALTTPTTEPVAPRGYHFTGWTFNLSN